MLSCEVWETFKNTYFDEHLQIAAFENVFLKLRKIKNYFWKKKQVFWTSMSETNSWFLLHDWFPMEISFVWWEINWIIKYLELIKRRSNVQEKNPSCEHALNFDLWKTFSKKYKPMRLWFCLQISWEFFALITLLQIHSNSKEVSYLFWQNTYPNLKTTYHIELKCFWWTKFLENLLLAKYLISVSAPLITKYN